MGKHKKMSLLSFQEQFSTEESCHNHLFSLKSTEGYRCDKCGNRDYFETKTRNLRLYECKQCRYRATVTVRTVMGKTRTRIIKWFLAIYLIAHDKRGISATRLSAELNLTYKTA